MPSSTSWRCCGLPMSRSRPPRSRSDSRSEAGRWGPSRPCSRGSSPRPPSPIAKTAAASSIPPRSNAKPMSEASRRSSSNGCSAAACRRWWRASPRMMTSKVVAEPMLMSGVAERSLIEQIGGWPTVLLVLWLGAAIGLFAARILAFRRERNAILRDATELGRIGSIRLVRSGEVSGPLAFGIFDRVIAVPADFDRLYAEHERRLALEHELAHHRSGDLAVNLVAFGLLCLQWFNPLAWVAHAAFRFDQEAACDARVLDKSGNQDRFDYGRAIAKAASGRALLFASALDSRTMLQRRLKSMLSNPTSGRRLTGRMAVLAAIAVALPLTATRAIHYVDVLASAPGSEPAKMPVPVLPVPAVAAVAQPAP